MKKSTLLRNDSPHTVKVQEGTRVAEHKRPKAAAVKEPEAPAELTQKLAPVPEPAAAPPAAVKTVAERTTRKALAPTPKKTAKSPAAAQLPTAPEKAPPPKPLEANPVSASPASAAAKPKSKAASQKAAPVVIQNAPETAPEIADEKAPSKAKAPVKTPPGPQVKAPLKAKATDKPQAKAATPTRKAASPQKDPTAPKAAPTKTVKPSPRALVQPRKKAAPRKAPAPAALPATASPMATAPAPQPAAPAVLDDALLWEQDSPVLARLAQLRIRNAALDEQLQRLKSPLTVLGKKP